MVFLLIEKMVRVKFTKLDRGMVYPLVHFDYGIAI
jgi:hypothetical protein